jgi:hypothetical protein
MIRSGRCDECRRRKRKVRSSPPPYLKPVIAAESLTITASSHQCDEQRPACVACVDRRVKCSYSNEVSKFVQVHQSGIEVSGSSCTSSPVPSPKSTQTTGCDASECQMILDLRTSKVPPSGDGLYHTFAPLKKAPRDRTRPTTNRKPSSTSIPRPLESDVAKLANAFGAVLHSADAPGLRLKFWGPWIEYIPSRVGSSPLIDRSVACMIAAHHARHCHTNDRAVCLARRRYGEALCLLRTRVGQGSESVSAAVIAATKLLMAFE